MWSEQALNQIGILLNVFSGFLLTPSIIGIQRIARAEEWARVRSTRAYQESRLRIAKRLLAARRFAKSLRKFAANLWRGFLRTFLPFWDSLSAPRTKPRRRRRRSAFDQLVVSLYGAILLLLPVAICASVGAFLAEFHVLRTWHLAVPLAVAISLVTTPLLLIFLSWLVLMIGAQFESNVVLYLSGALCLAGLWPLLYRFVGRSLQYYLWNMLRLFTKRVAGYLAIHDALLGAMTFVGMSCFVAGNALQFIATL